MENIGISYFFTMTIFVTFVGIVVAIFVDIISTKDIISSNSKTEVSAILFKYLLFSQIHALGFQL